MPVDALDAALQQLLGGDLAAARQRRIGAAEDVEQELDRLFGLAALAARQIALRARLGGLPERRGQAGRQREHGGGGQTGGQCMAAHEAAGAVAPAAAPRGDRPAGEMVLQIGRQLGHRCVAMRRVLAQRLERDRVEIAAQRAMQAPRHRRVGSAAGLQHGLARPRRLLVEDRPFVRGRRAAREAIRPPAGQQLVQQQAERVHVDRRGHRLAAHLLGRGVLGREHARGTDAGIAGIDQLGDAEIEQLDLSGRRDQQVRRLEIAMHDQPRMRMRDRRADDQEQTQPRGDAESGTFAVRAQVDAVDVLERQPRPVLAVDAAVDQPRDVGMGQAGQDLPLGAEARVPVGGIPAAANQLDRDLLRELAVGAFGQPDRAHAAAADLAQQPERADAATGEIGLGRPDRPDRRAGPAPARPDRCRAIGRDRPPAAPARRRAARPRRAPVPAGVRATAPAAYRPARRTARARDASSAHPRCLSPSCRLPACGRRFSRCRVAVAGTPWPPAYRA
ncbi:MAG: hypothetical protein NVV68_11175 [Dokdonella sp.]|nr:hypothetical protein [Dokdonella sp.]